MNKVKKEILSGNEAIARGFADAGGRFAASYPGTPATEALEELCRLPGIHAEWSINEKAALEAAIGGSLSGLRSMASMKHVGVNVAADPLMTASYTGVNAGLVLMAADDPGMFSSQNEQDTRHFARMAKIPCLEPSDSQEAMDFTRLALELSEQFDTPVILRTTTRISHSRSVVTFLSGERKVTKRKPDFLAADSGVLQINIPKYVMLPGYAGKRHVVIEKRLAKLQEWAESTEINKIIGSESPKPVHRRRLGIITSGVSFQYAREAFPEAAMLKLGMTWPLPERMIKEFAKGVKSLAVVEELDPFIEDAVRAMGVRVDWGKNVLPLTGEFTAGMVFEAISRRRESSPKTPAAGIPERPPNLCPGCSHRGLFVALSKLKTFVSGDIGCYTLGALEPFSAIHSVLCMGASVTIAHGISAGLKLRGIKRKPVAVIGDSTFLHSGITGLINLAYNGGDAIVVIMNNDTTGMTGGQEHPGTGRNAGGEKAPRMDIMGLCRACGLRVREIDTFDLKGLEALFREEMAAPGPVVLVSNQPCALRYRLAGRPLEIDAEKCTGCLKCLKAGCIGLKIAPVDGRRRVSVDRLVCNGCGICAQLCKAGAFREILA